MTDYIDGLFSKLVNQKLTPGISAIVLDKSGKSLYNNSFGRINANDETSPLFTNATQTLFWSITKSFVSIAILQLMERGLVNLDDPVSNYLPNEPPPVITGFDEDMNPITRPTKTEMKVIHLLTHSSGYTYDCFDELAYKYRSSKSQPVGNMLDSGGKWHYEDNYLEFDPGTRYNYSISIDKLGMLIEAVTGQALPDYIRENITEPLIMCNTAAHYTGEGYLRAHIKPAGQTGELITIPLVPCEKPYVYGGGTYMVGTWEDLSIFLLTLLNDGTNPSTSVSILNPETIKNYVFTDLLSQLGVSATDGPAPAGHVRKSLGDLGLSNTGDLLPPDIARGWGAGFLLNLEDVPGKRKKGSTSASGLGNIYCWIDRVAGVCGLVGTNMLPYMDGDVLGAVDEVERWVYGQVHT